MYNWFKKYNHFIVYAMSINHTNQTDPLEQLLTHTYSDYSIPETSGSSSWTKIKYKVIKHNFLKFNAFTFNAYYAVAVSVFTVIGVNIYNRSTQNAEDNQLSSPKEQFIPINQEEIEVPQTTDTLIVEPVIDSDQSTKYPVATKELIQISNSEPFHLDTNTPKSVKIKSQTTEPAPANTSSLKLKELTEKNKELPKDSSLINDGSAPKILQIHPVNETVDNRLKISTDSTLITTPIVDSISAPTNIRQQPVVITDTIVKVIKKRRKRKK